MSCIKEFLIYIIPLLPNPNLLGRILTRCIGLSTSVPFLGSTLPCVTVNWPMLLDL